MSAKGLRVIDQGKLHLAPKWFRNAETCICDYSKVDEAKYQYQNVDPSEVADMVTQGWKKGSFNKSTGQQQMYRGDEGEAGTGWRKADVDEHKPRIDPDRSRMRKGRCLPNQKMEMDPRSEEEIAKATKDAHGEWDSKKKARFVKTGKLTQQEAKVNETEWQVYFRDNDSGSDEVHLVNKVFTGTSGEAAAAAEQLLDQEAPGNSFEIVDVKSAGVQELEYTIGEEITVKRKYFGDPYPHEFPGNEVTLTDHPDIDIVVYRGKSGWIILDQKTGATYGTKRAGIGWQGFDTNQEAVQSYIDHELDSVQEVKESDYEKRLRAFWSPTVKEGEFDDIIKTPSKKDHFTRLGGTENPDGSFTFGKHTVHPNQLSKYPILSHVYQDNIFVVEKFDAIPGRAKATGRVIEELTKMGVEWIQFSQLKMIPPHKYELGSYQHPKVNSGLQAVGRYKDLGVIYETKVGVGNPSAGFIVWVGPFSDIQRAGSASKTTGSSGAALDIIKKDIAWYFFQQQSPKVAEGGIETMPERPRPQAPPMPQTPTKKPKQRPSTPLKPTPGQKPRPKADRDMELFIAARKTGNNE